MNRISKYFPPLTTHHQTTPDRHEQPPEPIGTPSLIVRVLVSLAVGIGVLAAWYSLWFIAGLALKAAWAL